MNAKGLVLINVVTVLLFLAVILGIAALVNGPLAKRMKAAETGKTIDAAVNSIVGYTTTNHRLPTLAEFTQIVHNSSDPWGNTLVYITSGNLTAIPTGSYEAVCRLKTTGTTITSGGTLIGNVAFAIVSRGPNFNNQTAGPSAVSVTLPEGGTTVDNYAGNGYYDIPGPARPEGYDDIVRWMTLDDLKNRIGCYGPTRGGLKILNTELPVACAGQAYNATVYGDGGVPPYSTTAPLPSGLTIDSSTGTISGTVSSAGVYPVTFTQTDSGGSTVQKILNLNIKTCPSWLGGFDSAASPGGTFTGGAAITGTGAAGTASALALIGTAPGFIPTDQGGGGYPKFNFDQNQAFSIMAWVKLTRFPTNPTASNIYPFVSKPGNSPTMPGYYLELHSSAYNPPNTSGSHRVAFRLIGKAVNGKTLTVYSTSNIDTLNVWYHIAASYNGSGLASGVRIYVNGASGKTAYQDNLGALSITNTNPLTVGYYDAPASWGSSFNSIYIDQVHVYKAEVQRLSTTVSGGGVVTSPAIAGSSEKINCGTLCEAFYPKNATVFLAAHPSPGSVFTGWSGSACSGTGICMITLGTDTSVTATFAP